MSTASGPTRAGSRTDVSFGQLERDGLKLNRVGPTAGSVRSLPPCGGGAGRGVPHGDSFRRALVLGASSTTRTFSWATPPPSPPPQGGRERTSVGAVVESHPITL